jgi:hypothetical protein
VSFIDIDPDIRDMVEEELYSGETLLWAGKSRPGTGLRRLKTPGGLMTLTMVGGLLAILGLVVLVIISAASSEPDFADGGAPVIAMIIPIIAVFMAMVAAMIPITRMFSNRNAIYALTDRRALILARGASGARSVKSFGESDIQRIERRMYADGTGDVVFAHEYRSNAAARSGLYGTGGESAIGFMGISNAREVEMLMLETFKMNAGGNAYKYKHDELADDGELVIEDDLSAFADDEDRRQTSSR